MLLRKGKFVFVQGQKKFMEQDRIEGIVNPNQNQEQLQGEICFKVVAASLKGTAKVFPAMNGKVLF